jgi:uncharacterized protein (DUF58 family)
VADRRQAPVSTVQEAPERLLLQLDWRVLRRLDGLLQGDYRTLLYGAGIDFTDLRDYQVGDDVRHIEWNVTARLNSPLVRQYTEDRELTAWFLLDRSPSMGFGPLDRPKGLVLVEFVTAMARLLTRGGNRVGAILYNNGIEQMIEARTGRKQVLRIARDLLRPPRMSGALTDLAGLLDRASRTIPRRSLVFMVSDFISEPGWERSLHLLSRRHEVVAIQLWDPREVELPNAGVLAFEDAETGEQLMVDTSDPVFRQRFSETVAKRAAHLRASTERVGVDLFPLSTEEDLTRALVRMSELRKRRFR